MLQLERLGTDGICDRELLLLELPDLASLPRDLALGHSHFACLILLDAWAIGVQAIGDAVERLLLQGAVYFCVWGPDCERVHDIIDEEIVGGGPEIPRFSYGIMTSWHENETLDEALWFFLNCAFTDDEFKETCRAGIVISVGHPDWAAQARAALADPAAFSERVLEQSPDDTQTP